MDPRQPRRTEAAAVSRAARAANSTSVEAARARGRAGGTPASRRTTALRATPGAERRTGLAGHESALLDLQSPQGAQGEEHDERAHRSTVNEGAHAAPRGEENGEYCTPGALHLKTHPSMRSESARDTVPVTLAEMNDGTVPLASPTRPAPSTTSSSMNHDGPNPAADSQHLSDPSELSSSEAPSDAHPLDPTQLPLATPVATLLPAAAPDAFMEPVHTGMRREATHDAGVEVARWDMITFGGSTGADQDEEELTGRTMGTAFHSLISSGQEARQAVPSLPFDGNGGSLSMRNSPLQSPFTCPDSSRTTVSLAAVSEVAHSRSASCNLATSQILRSSHTPLSSRGLHTLFSSHSVLGSQPLPDSSSVLSSLAVSTHLRADTGSAHLPAAGPAVGAQLSASALALLDLIAAARERASQARLPPQGTSEDPPLGAAGGPPDVAFDADSLQLCSHTVCNSSAANSALVAHGSSGAPEALATNMPFACEHAAAAGGRGSVTARSKASSRRPSCSRSSFSSFGFGSGMLQIPSMLFSKRNSVGSMEMLLPLPPVGLGSA